jgi:hypothetical protein
MAETILLNKDIETKVRAGYNVFEKYLESLEATLKCQQKARWAQSVKHNPRANGASPTKILTKSNTYCEHFRAPATGPPVVLAYRLRSRFQDNLVVHCKIYDISSFLSEESN